MKLKHVFAKLLSNQYWFIFADAYWLINYVFILAIKQVEATFLTIAFTNWAKSKMHKENLQCLLQNKQKTEILLKNCAKKTRHMYTQNQHKSISDCQQHIFLYKKVIANCSYGNQAKHCSAKKYKKLWTKQTAERKGCSIFWVLAP